MIRATFAPGDRVSCDNDWAHIKWPLGGGTVMETDGGMTRVDWDGAPMCYNYHYSVELSPLGLVKVAG